MGNARTMSTNTNTMIYNPTIKVKKRFKKPLVIRYY